MVSPLVVLLPPTEADEDEAAYYRERLEDLSLMEAALTVRVGGVAYLAVPVGGARRGGYLPMPELAMGCAVRDALRGTPGFPDVRLRWSPYEDACHVVAWGERAPEDDELQGRFYGYSAEAITQALAR
ncbi:DUF6302 family protein [Streptomyces sp. NPDC092952]|uniref:DUF6302 family protein n=1 Tax=Streptomyces sp. NPDC092952 TaxID=3366018 RepID=UPI003824EC36